MSNVIHPPQFDRPKVFQPHPRLKRGTVSFRKALAERLMAKRLDGRSPEQVRERSERLRQRWADLREAEIIPLHIPNAGAEAYALVRTFMQLGLSVTFDTKRNALVLCSREPFSPAS